MKDLIGFRCCCIFNLPHTEWPFEGFPAWVVVEAVDMPMVKMRSTFGQRGMWVNSATIKTISAIDKEPELSPWWVRFLTWAA